MCMKYPDHENCVHEDWCEKTFTEKSGSIKIDSDMYTDKVSCLWQFNMPASHTLEFQFVGDFDLEYHYKCGYDRVHIFSGKILEKFRSKIPTLAHNSNIDRKISIYGLKFDFGLNCDFWPKMRLLT